VAGQPNQAVKWLGYAMAALMVTGAGEPLIEGVEEASAVMED